MLIMMIHELFTALKLPASGRMTMNSNIVFIGSYSGYMGEAVS